MTYGKRVFKPFKAGINRAIDTILPPRCIGTGEIVDGQGMIAPKLWQNLDFISSPFCKTCGLPFDFEDVEEISTNPLCGTCIAEPPRFDLARSALVYNDASRQLLLRFKYGDHQHAAIPFARWMMMCAASDIKDADLIIPVPLHWQRLWQRRYNQSALLARALSRLSGLKTAYDILTRKRYTGSQKGLSKRDRRKNVRMAFYIPPHKKQWLKGKNIILIDDVMTSGATLDECTKVLKRAGAANVTCLTLARVMPSISYTSEDIEKLDF